MDIWWTLHLRREAASVPLARRILLGTMATAGVDPEVTHEVSIALSEACANAVEHAVPTGAEDDSFQVTATIVGDRLRIEVNDSGTDWTAPTAPTAPTSAAAPMGRPAPRPVRRRARPVACIPADAGRALPEDAAESGRGLFLIRALTDHVQISNHPTTGSVVAFDKHLTYRRERELLSA